MTLLVASVFTFVAERFWTARDQHLALLAGHRTTTTVNLVLLRKLEALAVLIALAVVASAIWIRRAGRSGGAAVATVAGLIVSLVGFQVTPGRFFSGVPAGSILRYPHRFAEGATLNWLAAGLMLLAAVLFAVARPANDPGARSSA
ncbi:MAG: hypothetical protein JWL79_3850 [Frankiales bacterium]|jgi:xanthine/uracil permease|nr:hypothetical protein [Frankiales bacterium]